MSYQVFIDAYRYAGSHPEQLLEATQQHLLLIGIPLGAALLIGGSLGWQCASWSREKNFISQAFVVTILNLFNVFRVIPSLAILFLLIPVLGLTFQAAAMALCLLATPPIILATEVGFRTVSTSIRETGVAMGMTSWQLFYQVDVPLAFPVVLAGIKTATLEVIASATLAAFIGAGGLGRFMTLGFALNDPAILLVGAIPVASLALMAELSLNQFQRFFDVSAHS